jgi:hypothetical protein
MKKQDTQIHALGETLVFDLTKAFGLPQNKYAMSMVRLLFGRAVGTAAEIGVGMDCAVAEGGIAAGARWLLPCFVKAYEARGVERIPSSGPLVIASNHPAGVDSIVISAYIERPDYKVIIGNIPFFQHLPHVSKHAIYAPEKTDTTGRMEVIRAAIRHLRQGGALLIFPRGGIEADPEFMPEPDGQFSHWSRSLEIFMQRVPNLQILVTIASGVISRPAMQHPVTRLRKARPDRQRLAFIYQFLRQMLSGRQTYNLVPRVTFGEVICGSAHEHTLQEIEQAARRTLQQHMRWAHV